MTEKMLRALIALWSLQGSEMGDFFPEDVAIRATMLGVETRMTMAAANLSALHDRGYVKRGALEGTYLLSVEGERLCETARKMFERIMDDRS